MKKCFCYILLFVVLCLTNCQRRVAYPPVLLRVDSLTYVNPRIALQMLDSIREEMTKAEEPIHMYYQLLTVKAQDKGYITHTSDSLMLTLVDYYEHKGDKSLLPEAYYYLGSTYRDLKDAPRALDAYQKALDVVDKTPSSLLRMIHNQMGWLYYRQYMYDDALASYLEGYKCDSLLRDSFEMSSDLVNIASIYGVKEDYDSFKECLILARKIADRTNNQFMCDEVDTQLAGLYIELERYDEAKQLIQSPIEHANPSNLSSVYSIAAKAYLRTGNIDSAFYYYKVLLREGKIYAQRAAYEGLADIALKENKIEEANGYIKIFKQLTDSAQRITASESVAQMKSLYDYQLREKENMQLQQQKVRIRNRFIVTALVSAILIIILGASIFIYRKRQRLLTLQMNLMKLNTEEQYKKTSAYIEHNKQEIIKLTTQIDQLQQDISTEKETHFNEKQRLLEELERQRQKIEQQNKLAEIEIKERSDAGEKVLDSDIYKELRTAIDSKKLMTERMLEQVVNLLNKLYPDFLTTIQPCNLSKTNYVICLLTKIGIQSIDIATLVGRERSTITKAKLKIYKKITGLDGKAIDFDNYIQML